MLKDYVERLKVNLGDKYYVTDEEQIDYPVGKIVCIVSNYNSINYRSSIEFQLQLQFLTNTIKETMNELSVWSWENNDTSFALSNYAYVKQLITQPNNNSNFVQTRSEYIGTIIVNVTLLASFNLTDVKELYIDGEVVNPNQFTFSYNTIPDNQRNNNEELNSTLINESNLQCQIVFPLDNTNFMKKLRSIMFGKLSKNTIFTIKIIYIDEEEFELDFRLSSESLNIQRGTLTTKSATLIH